MMISRIPLISRFLEYLDGERNFSPHTVRSYQADLTQFCRFLAADHNADKISVEDLPAPNALGPAGKLTCRILAVQPLDIRRAGHCG